MNIFFFSFYCFIDFFPTSITFFSASIARRTTSSAWRASSSTICCWRTPGLWRRSSPRTIFCFIFMPYFPVCLSVCPFQFRRSCSASFCHSVCLKTSPNSCSLSQNVTNKSYLVCVKSEKYASWVTLRAQLDCCRRGAYNQI